MVSTCCVPGCKKENMLLPVHRFPTSLMLAELWLAKIGREDLKKLPLFKLRPSYRICDRHFDDDSRYVGTWTNSTINRDAVPTLFLPVVESSSGNSYQDEQSPNVIAAIDERLNPNIEPLEINTVEEISDSAVSSTSPSEEIHSRKRKLDKDNSIESSQETNLRSMVYRLQRENQHLRNKVKADMEKFKNVEKVLKKRLNKPTFDFVMSQLRCQSQNKILNEEVK